MSQPNKTSFHPQTLHEDIAASILNPDAPHAENLNGQIVQNDISVDGRLNIYKNNVVGGLIDVMLARYPTITPLVGEEFARQMARVYILDNPPSSGNLNEYGGDYAAFIRNFPPAAELLFLVDMAELENFEHLAYYAPDGQELNLENAEQHLPNVMAGNTALALHPSVGLLRSEFPLLKLREYTAAKSDETDDFDLSAGPEYILIWRFGYRVETLSLSAANYAFMQALQNGEHINQALEAALHEDENFAFADVWQEMLRRDVFIVKDE